MDCSLDTSFFLPTKTINEPVSCLLESLLLGPDRRLSLAFHRTNHTHWLLQTALFSFVEQLRALQRGRPAVRDLPDYVFQ